MESKDWSGFGYFTSNLEKIKQLVVCSKHQNTWEDTGNDFTQRFRTTPRHLISIQLLWKPKILKVEDKRTKFEQSKGDLCQF